MQNQPQVINIAIIPKINIHFFKYKTKAVVASGTCQIVDNDSTIILKIQDSKTQLKKKEKLAKLKQINYTTFFYSNDNGSILTLSLKNQDYQSIFKFEQVISQHCEIVQYFSLPHDSEFKQKILLETPIDQQYPGEFGSNNDDKLQSIGKGVGSVFGGISSIFNTEKMNKQSDQLITKISRDTFSESTISQWQRLKNKVSQINQSLGNAIKPIGLKCSQIVSDIGKNFENSNNGFIRGVRQYSKKTQKALNQGYGKADAPRRVSFANPNQNPGTRPPTVEIKQQILVEGKPVSTPYQSLQVEQPINLRQSTPAARKVTFDVPKVGYQSNSNERKSLL